MIAVRDHRSQLVLGALCLVLAGCPRPAEAELPLYEEVLLAQKPKHPAAKDNWTLDMVLADEVGEGEESAQGEHVSPPAPVLTWESFLAGSQSESVGSASRGKLKHGREMPKRGEGFLRKNEKAVWGTDETVAILTWAALEMTRRYPGTVAMVVGDLSNQSGGKLRPHVSHQSGRDADVGYYIIGNKHLTHFRTATREDLDVEKNWTLLELLINTGMVQYLFVDHRFHKQLYRQALATGWSEEDARRLFEAPIGKAKRSGIIRHIPGHKHHFHVRFRCPEGDQRCK